MSGTPSWTEFIKSNVRIEDYIGLDETLKPKGIGSDELVGGHVKGSCSANAPSKSGTRLQVNVSKQTFNCLACSAQGSIIDYVMDRDGLDIAGACELLASENNLVLPDDTRTPEQREAAKEARARSSTVSELLNHAAAFYHAQLTPKAVAYYHGRGITDATIAQFQLGYAGGNNRALLQHLYQHCGERETLLATGLFYESEDGKLYDTFVNRYPLPYWRSSRQVCYFIARDATGRDKGKYKKQPMKDYVDTGAVEHILWNQSAIDGSKPVVIVEGILDAILMAQELSERYHVISPVTTQINKKDIEQLVKRFVIAKPKQVIFCNDNETSGAGAKGALATAETLEAELYQYYYDAADDDDSVTDKNEHARKCLPYLTIATLPKPPEIDKIDVADYLADGKRDEVLYWLRASRSITQYRQWQEENPRRFFSGKTFYPKRLSDEARTEGYYLYAGERLHRYDAGVYKAQPQAITRAIGDKLQQEWKAERIRETLQHMQIQTHVDIDTPNPSDVVSFKNGNVHVYQNGKFQFKPHSPHVLTTHQVEANWNPDARIERFGKFLEEIVIGSDVTTLMEMIGYGMMNSTNMDKAFLLLGEGANGKTTLLNIITGVYGEENVCAIPFQRLQENSFASANLYGKLANLVPDMSIRALRDSDMFKSIVSGDRITGERKHKDSFEFRPKATLIVSVNRLPLSFDDSFGFFRRLIIIKFPHDFEKRADKRDRDELEAEVLRDRDGIATQCLVAAIAAMDRKHFTISESTQQVTLNYRAENNPHERFLQESTTADAEGVIASRALYTAYKEWLAETEPNRSPLSESKFGQAVQRTYPQVEKRRTNVEGSTTRRAAWHGILATIEIED